MDPYQQSQWPGWSYSGGQPQYGSYQSYEGYPAYLHDSMDSYSTHHHQQHLVHHQQMSRTTESKPRLSKEEVEILETEFQKNHKPNSSTKKALAESMRVDNARINNWFQNRRAREKKENNIRQYEARQRLEKEQTDSDPRSKLDLVESRGLVASSAPFPASRGLTRASSRSTNSPVDDDTTEDACSDASDEIVRLSLPISAIQAQVKLEARETTTELMYTSSSETPSLSSSGTFGKINGTSPGFFYGPSQTYARPDESNEPTPSMSSLRFPRHHIFSSGGADSQYGSDQELDYLSQSSPGATSAPSPTNETDLTMRSPDSLDIASRRNRRPPPLSIGGSRSYTGNGPRTALDHNTRAEFGREMRRVASANGSVRVSKPIAAPRSPFHDRRTENLFHLNRSPVMTGLKPNVAPPTPDTPIVAAQSGLADGLSSTHTGIGGKIQTSGFSAHDPTLRTPPATPGIGETFFSLNSAYDMSISDQPLVTPSLTNFSNDFDVPSLPLTAPEYVTGPATCASQPETTAFTAPMGPAYFGFAGGNAEYNWSGGATSGRVSPGQQNVQFMNMTTSNFN